MAEPKRDKRPEQASKDFDIPSPYEDYSNMLKNFNTDSDFIQTLSPPQGFVQNLDFSGNHAVEKHLVDSQESIGQNISCTSGEKLPPAGFYDPLDCSKCDVMREVMHTNGIFVTVLSIHGQPGVFYHATLEVYHYTEGFPLATNLSYIDFKNKDFGWIRRFLLEYGAVRRRENYTVINDCVAPFYQVICAGANLKNKPKDAPGSGEVKHEGASSPLSSEFEGSSSNIKAKTESINQNSSNSDSVTSNKKRHPLGKVQEQQCMKTTSNTSTSSHARGIIHISEQRKRTAKMRPRDIAKYFHLPLMEAAKELQICTSSLKSICRKHGITRWPQRKIRAIDNRIACLKKDLKSQTSVSETANRITREINWLQEKREAVCSGAQSPLIKEEQRDAGEGDEDGSSNFNQ